MNEYFEAARKKINEGSKDVKGAKESAMKQAVSEALLSFCEQNGEFAQAVAQGGSFADCMADVAKGVSSSISDLNAYKKAVAFYFRGADIHFQMTITLCPAELPQTVTDSGRVIIDLADFL